MKHSLMTYVLLMCFALVLGAMSPLNSKTAAQKTKTIGDTTGTGANKPSHIASDVNCKTCHNGEYPTKKDPLLAPCPRNQMISIYHSPSEGPNIVVIDELENRYGKVIFSHRIHSQMSEMAGGCGGCHHYNTTGRFLNCKKCHEKTASAKT